VDIMSVLVVASSTKSARGGLERSAVSGDTVTKLLRDVVQPNQSLEAFVAHLQNRVEVYADVYRFPTRASRHLRVLARALRRASH